MEQAAQTGLHTALGEVELDDLLSQRETSHARRQTILDEHTEPWGIKVTQVQVKQVDLPQDMQRAIAAQAEAERERRAKIIAVTELAPCGGTACRRIYWWLVSRTELEWRIELRARR